VSVGAPDLRKAPVPSYGEEVRQLVGAADELLEERNASEALEQWIARLAQYAMTKHGLASALQVATRQPAESFPDTYEPIVGALAKLIAAAEEAGSVKPGLSADDVILLFAGLWQMDPRTDWKPNQRASMALSSRACKRILFLAKSDLLGPNTRCAD
jgi:hypothetical protein